MTDWNEFYDGEGFDIATFITELQHITNQETP